MDAGVIRLSRVPSRWRDRGRRYVVLIDDEAVGKIRQGETLEFVLAPGAHSLRLKVDWKGSDEIGVQIEVGQVASFLCEPNGGARSAPLDVVRKSKPWVTLRRS